LTTISWTYCGHILAELSCEERVGLRAIAGGQRLSMPAPLLEKLKSKLLVKFDGQAWVLTDDGQVVAYWSDIVRAQ
jgi:hypothetical protein